MGVALEKAPNLTVLSAHPRLTFQKYGYTWTIETKGDVSTYTVSDGVRSQSWPIRYAFGVGAQTFLIENGGRYYESLVTYYPKIAGLDITMGSERVQPHDLVQAMGILASNEEITSCFGCHTSGGVSQGQLHFESLRPGVDCEHCHTGATAHMQSMQQGTTGPAPKKLGDLTAEDLSNFCGQCHRTWDTVVRLRLWGTINVRFQPYRLANSKCFLGDDKRIACTGCHNPHQDVVRDDASYDRNCLACHSTNSTMHLQAISKSSDKPKEIARTCPVSAHNCVSCHMQKIELPGGHTVFTDHDIRVIRPGDRYPN